MCLLRYIAYIFGNILKKAEKRDKILQNVKYHLTLYDYCVIISKII